MVHIEVNQLPGMFAPSPDRTWCWEDGEPWPCAAVRQEPSDPARPQALLGVLTPPGTPAGSEPSEALRSPESECRHGCPCSSDDECPHECPCDEQG